MQTFWKSVEEKIITNIVISEGNLGCWLWTGSLRTSGYGRVWIHWPGQDTCSEELAHRVAYMCSHHICKQELDRSKEVGHLCHLKACVRAEHLVFERHHVNMERAFCKTQGTCTKNHRPECIL